MSNERKRKARTDDAPLPDEDDVLRRLMATPPHPRKAKPQRKAKKRAAKK